MHNRKKYLAGRRDRLVWLLILIVSCIYIAETSGGGKHTLFDAFWQSVQSDINYEMIKSSFPMLAYDASASGQKTVYDYISEGMEDLLPIYAYVRRQDAQYVMGELMAGEEGSGGQVAADLYLQENDARQEEMDLQGLQGADAGDAEPAAASEGARVKTYDRRKLMDFDYLLQNFYRVDSTTTTNSSQLNAAEMLAKDMRVDKEREGPQILIYHTHSQERFADSQDASQSVVGLGDYLADILEEKYGYRVLHHKGSYDVPDRDNAYSRAAPALEKLLAENPQIQVIIDLHRDGVAEGTRLVEKINGKDTATIMFFNGLSHTTAQGDIGYLANPNLADNLAFSFQMQLAAAEYYPGFSRCIYLKGYRYNMQYLPKSLLVEVGAQTNTYQEAVNAMEPLADVLNKVLGGESRT